MKLMSAPYPGASTPMMTVFIKGDPVGQPRPRSVGFVSRKTGKVTSRMYNPGTADEWREAVCAGIRGMIDASDALEGPVYLALHFMLARPKGHLGSDGSPKAWAPLYVASKPDLDNLVKATMDAMTEAGVWLDDKQVVIFEVAKTYTNGQPGCVIEWRGLCAVGDIAP
jgi:Holliday junction resolvase RusA-like endonuclease